MILCRGICLCIFVRGRLIIGQSAEIGVYSGYLIIECGVRPHYMRRFLVDGHELVEEETIG